MQQHLCLGNLDGTRDWGYAGDYVEAMWLMLQAGQSDDFLIATGRSRSVLEFLQEVFGLLGLEWKEHVQVDPRYFRPAEVDCLQGDASKAERVLGWRAGTDFSALVKMMVERDLELARQECTVAPRGALNV